MTRRRRRQPINVTKPEGKQRVCIDYVCTGHGRHPQRLIFQIGRYTYEGAPQRGTYDAARLGHPPVYENRDGETGVDISCPDPTCHQTFRQLWTTLERTVDELYAEQVGRRGFGAHCRVSRHI